MPPHPGAGNPGSGEERVAVQPIRGELQRYVRRRGMPCTRRERGGRDVTHACRNIAQAPDAPQGINCSLGEEAAAAVQ